MRFIDVTINADMYDRLKHNTPFKKKKGGGGAEPLVLYHRMSCTLAEALSLSHKVISSSQFNLSLSCTNMHTFNYSLIISVSFHSVFTLNQSIENICIISHFHTWMPFFPSKSQGYCTVNPAVVETELAESGLIFGA